MPDPEPFRPAPLTRMRAEPEMTASGLVSTFDPAKNLLLINTELYDQLSNDLQVKVWRERKTLEITLAGNAQE